MGDALKRLAGAISLKAYHFTDRCLTVDRRGERIRRVVAARLADVFLVAGTEGQCRTQGCYKP